MSNTESDVCMERPPGSEGVYLYCFTRGAVAGLIQATGVEDDTEVTSVTIGEVAAIFSKVSLDAFIGPSGDANLRDVSWIVPRARQHERVVEEVMHLSPVLPARFGSVLSSTSVLEQLVTVNAETIRQFIEGMADREEWSVKASLDLPQTESWMLASQAMIDEAPGESPVSPGMRYIQDKRIRAHARRRMEDWSRQTAEDIERSIAVDADDLRLLPPPPSGTAGTNGRLILNCALLVSKGRLVELRERAADVEQRYADAGLSLSLSGPWPPYSFCPSILDVDSCQ